MRKKTREESIHSLAFSFFLPVTVLLFALCLSAKAQQPMKMARIGYLSPGDPVSRTYRTEAFRQGLRERGYVEGKNIIIEYRWADGKLDRLPELAAELVGLGVDILVAGATPPVLAAKKATNTIPIVAANADNLVELGVVASLARPGGNVTGITEMAPELTPKRLEMLKQIVPTLSRVAILWQPGSLSEEAFQRMLKDTEASARSLGIQIQVVEAKEVTDFDGAFAAMARVLAAEPPTS